jgi:hypothetical protein
MFKSIDDFFLYVAIFFIQLYYNTSVTINLLIKAIIYGTNDKLEGLLLLRSDLLV